ncbi:HNH endonuclease [Paraburkholderia azotifigens]|uniref:HNH endonuclease n=1 Tax=Paraburkholderia azotifigens TaxID=2057004 RepID=UPI0038B93CD6
MRGETAAIMRLDGKLDFGGNVTLNDVHALFRLEPGEQVSKRNLYDLIRLSKIKGSPFWSGDEFVIQNTPQQGINWIGNWPLVRGIIVKTRAGAYGHDGWANEEKSEFRYSFKARDGNINYKEKANATLIEQPRLLYPIFLFCDYLGSWQFEGRFSVTDIADEFVILARTSETVAYQLNDEIMFFEGGRKYVSHVMSERNRHIVSTLKGATDWKCDICESTFETQYGIRYIEAHHKIPISTYSSTQAVRQTDFALLCPNCHKAVHLYMQRDSLEYDEIKTRLSSFCKRSV